MSPPTATILIFLLAVPVVALGSPEKKLDVFIYEHGGVGVTTCLPPLTRASICKPFKEPRIRLPTWRNRFLGSLNFYKLGLWLYTAHSFPKRNLLHHATSSWTRVYVYFYLHRNPSQRHQSFATAVSTRMFEEEILKLYMR